MRAVEEHLVASVATLAHMMPRATIRGRRGDGMPPP